MELNSSKGSGSVSCPCIESEMEILSTSMDDLIYKTQMLDQWPQFPKGWGSFNNEKTFIHARILYAEAIKMLDRAKYFHSIGKNPSAIVEIAVKFLASIHEKYNLEGFGELSDEFKFMFEGKKKKGTKPGNENWEKGEYSTEEGRAISMKKGKALTEDKEKNDDDWKSGDYVDDGKKAESLKAGEELF